MDTLTRESQVTKLLEKEKALFAKENPKSKALQLRGLQSLVHGVPMHWMSNWASPFPLYLSSAKGARLIDADGHEYSDFCLGDTGAMFGHGNEAVSEVIRDQIGKGSTAMLPTEDAVWIGENLQKRFRLPFWQFTTSATDANRFAIRLCRIMTGRDKVLVFNGKYHGSLDETQVHLDNGKMSPQPGISPNAVDFSRTTKIVEFNDVKALEEALAARDVACVLAEPMMTNVGMVPPEQGYHEALREITRRTGTLLILDETHTISTGPEGYTGAYRLEPDIFVLGKAVAGGIPAAFFGMSDEVAKVMKKYTELDNYKINHCGFGGTLAGNALTLRAIRATLEKVMTQENYSHMSAMAEQFEKGVADVIHEYQLPWHVTRIGARVEYMFSKEVPRNGGEALAANDSILQAAIHLFLLNRGVLLTPFHNMALMCPQTTKEDVDRHTHSFRDCVKQLV